MKKVFKYLFGLNKIWIEYIKYKCIVLKKQILPLYIKTEKFFSKIQTPNYQNHYFSGELYA